MAQKTYHCPECEAAIPLYSARKFDTFVNYTCPNCHIILGDYELVERLAYAILKWGGGVGLNRDEVLAMAWDILRQARLAEVERFYHGLVAPRAIRNTFTNSVESLIPPAYVFRSAGASAESNKLYEVGLEWRETESYDAYGIFGPNTGVAGDYPFSIQGMLACAAHTPANQGSDGWAAIEFGSMDRDTPAIADCGFFHLRSQLTSPKEMTIVTSGGLGEQSETASFTVPDVWDPYNNAPPIYPSGGHEFMIEFDPHNRRIDVYIRGSRMWSLQNRNAYPRNFGSVVAYPSVKVGLVLYSGTQTGPSICVANWSSIRLIDRRLDIFGADT